MMPVEHIDRVLRASLTNAKFIEGFCEAERNHCLL